MYKSTYHIVKFINAKYIHSVFTEPVRELMTISLILTSTLTRLHIQPGFNKYSCSFNSPQIISKYGHV